jgi:hypothetical protein
VPKINVSIEATYKMGPHFKEIEEWPEYKNFMAAQLELSRRIGREGYDWQKNVSKADAKRLQEIGCDGVIINTFLIEK